MRTKIIYFYNKVKDGTNMDSILKTM